METRRMALKLLTMRKFLLRVFVIIVAGYILICSALYLKQESLVFYPDKLPANYTFLFPQPFKEMPVKTKDGTTLSSVLFTADNAKGVIFYLHGNAGALNSWGEVAQTYTALNYDVFMLDYRGYGKSEGSITSQQQMFDDVQSAYDTVKAHYAEDKITVLGYSIGTGPAAYIAANNKPGRLILQAPYYSLTDMMRHTYPIIPTFILKYKFATSDYLKQCTAPLTIFHGDADEVIYYGSSLKLQKLFKPGDTLITLHNQGHNGITENEEYKAALTNILAAHP